MLAWVTSRLSPVFVAGLERDAESGTEHAQFRNYASAQGRWLAPDPYMGSYDLTNPQSMNRYAYVLNNPTSLVDPSGLFVCLTCSDDGSGGGGGDGFDGGGDDGGGGNPGGVEGGGGSTPKAPNKPTCSNNGYGVAAGYGGTTALGVGAAGAEANGALGGAAAVSPQNGASAGGYASGAAAAYAGSQVTGVPQQNDNTYVLGAYAGAGLNFSVFHAGSVYQLHGPFNSFNINIGAGVVSAGVQFVWSGSTWELTVTPPIPVINPGVGVSASFTTTNTKITKHAGC